ncbi:MAG: GGDEF domain-containing protein [Elusimicrobiales bacterium]
MRKRIISFLKDIENSSSQENVMSNVTRAIKMLYPLSDVVFLVSPNTPPVEDIFRTKTSLFIADTSKDSRYHSKIWSVKERSVIMLAIIVFSRVVGVLKIYAASEGYFTRDDFITLEIISTTASTTLENISLYRNLVNLARKDALTGLFTRRIFDEKIDEEILVSARTKKPFCLLIMDIDHFKRINDTYGHQVGDEVIKGLASTIISNVREFDFVARYGGEEFAVIMPLTGKKDAVEIALCISEAVKKLSFSVGTRSFGITISGGVGEFPSEGQSKTQIIRTCDERLYAAKRAGRDRMIYE